MGTKIAVLDDYQELSKPHFDRLRDAGYDVTTFTDTLLRYNHPDTPQEVKDALVKRLEPFAIICTMRERTPIPAELIAQLPNLKLLLTTGRRNAALDVQACRARGVPVAGTDAGAKRRGPNSTTTHCVAMILALARNVAQDDAVMKTGTGNGWQTEAATELSGRVFGTVGLGRLGTSVAKIMNSAFGMRVVAWSSNLTQEAADAKAREVGLPVEDEEDGEKTFKVVSWEELFRTADVGLITREDLAKMKKSALFINTARGPIVNEAGLLEAANSGSIRGVGLDVFVLEPLPHDSPWRTTRWGEEGRARVLLTPHMGYVEEGTMASWYEQQVENILRWEKGEPLKAEFADSGY
ncbi:hypothetical protein PG994_008448 [Apiospora phragmitis]|uniref:D-2-hydroxyacid dehydrogenase family protein n=1 Tax=Apiospora phragmitis TaxID=2905665 RepID=A0ABR1UGG3_9PEZI